MFVLWYQTSCKTEKNYRYKKVVYKSSMQFKDHMKKKKTFFSQSYEGIISSLVAQTVEKGIL